MLILSATALPGTMAPHHFTDVGAVAHAIGQHLGAAAGAIFAVALLNASLLCAATVSLSGSYAIAEVFGHKHSLHRSLRDAKAFHASFAAIVALAAGVVLIPGLPFGALTTLVQALAGILLPSTLVLLLILANDEQLLGPLTNGRWLNAIAGITVAAILGLSTLLTITNVLPRLRIETALLATAGLLLAGAVALGASILRNTRPPIPTTALTPWQRRTWSAPTLELLRPATRTRPQLPALVLLRGYILLIAGLLLLKLAGVLPS